MVYAGRLTYRHNLIFWRISLYASELWLGACLIGTTQSYGVSLYLSLTYGWAPDKSAQSVKGGVFDGARSLVWVYGWAPDLIRFTDTTATTHDGGTKVDGRLLATPSAFKVT
jgi:hypothetical protein